MDKVSFLGKSYLKKWELKTLRSKNKYINYFNSLVLGIFNEYKNYRIKNFIISNVLRFILHLFEFFVLYLYVEKTNLFKLIYFKVVLFVFSQFWWGILESQRAIVRKKFASKSLFSKGFNIKELFINSAFYSLLVTCLVFVSLIQIQQIDDFLFSYIIFSLFFFFCNVFIRGFHSFIYSIRRIYYPLWSILLKDFVYLLVLTLFVFSLKTNAVLIAMAISGIISLYVNWKLILDTYKKVGVPIIFKEKYSFKSQVLFNMETFKYGLGFCGVKIFSIFPMFLVTSVDLYQFNVGINYIFLFYLLSPLLSISYNWTNLFYFDYKRLDSKIYSNMKKKLASHLLKVTIEVIALVSFMVLVFSLMILDLKYDFKSIILLILFILSMNFMSFYSSYLFANDKINKLLFFTGINIVNFIIFTQIKMFPELTYLVFFLIQLIVVSIFILRENFRNSGKLHLQIYNDSVVSFIEKLKANNDSENVLVILKYEYEDNLNAKLERFAKDISRRYKSVITATCYCEHLIILLPKKDQTIFVSSARLDLVTRKYVLEFQIDGLINQFEKFFFGEKFLLDKDLFDSSLNVVVDLNRKVELIEDLKGYLRNSYLEKNISRYCSNFTIVRDGNYFLAPLFEKESIRKILFWNKKTRNSKYLNLQLNYYNFKRILDDI